MNSTTRRIEKIAEHASTKVKWDKLPVPVEDIAKAFEVEVVPFAFHNKISGLLKKEDGIIGVNKSHHPVRQRFTVAHELGHFLLGHGVGGDVYQEEHIDEAFDKPHDQEKEANVFASCLLMPAAWVKKEVKQNGLNLEKLAKSFDVSKQAITIRLLDLKLI